jgi:serine/threonine-protein kinase RsbW
VAEVRPEGPDVITLTIPRRLELLSLLDQVALSLSERLQFNEEERSAISLSVVEAGTNAIQHGHHADGVTPVDVRFELHPDRLSVTVHDRGTGFSPPPDTPDVTSPEHLLDARGRGIFIMRACMDKVQFEFSGGGTTVRLTKMRHPDVNGDRPRD